MQDVEVYSEKIFKFEMEFFFVLAAAIFVGFYAQTIVGFAAGMLAMPALLVVLSFNDAIAVFSIFSAIFSMIIVGNALKDISKSIALRILIFAGVGLFIGIQLLQNIDSADLRVAMGFLIICIALTKYFDLKVDKIIRLPPEVFGLIGGISSGIFAMGGPFFVISVTRKLKKVTEIRATIIAVIAAVNFFRIPMFAIEGFYSWQIIEMSIYALPAFFLAMFLGHKTYKKIDDRTFSLILTILLVIAGLLLIFSKK